MRYTLLFLLLSLSAVLRAQTDANGCKDHELIPSRMPGYFIESCDKNEYSAHATIGDNGEELIVEGKKTVLNYRRQSNGTAVSDTYVRKNYMEALKKQGAVITHSEYGRGVAHFKKPDGGVVWVDVTGYIGDGTPEQTDLYVLVVVEIAPMEQVITAKSLGDDLKNTGRSVLYIQFETGKAVIQQESYPIIEQMAALLNNDKSLKVYIVGHTDNVGNLESNLVLSEERAKAVLALLVNNHKVNAAQVITKGVGPLSPIANNTTEDGRKLNRRVELVKQ